MRSFYLLSIKHPAVCLALINNDMRMTRKNNVWNALRIKYTSIIAARSAPLVLLVLVNGQANIAGSACTFALKFACRSLSVSH